MVFFNRNVDSSSPLPPQTIGLLKIYILWYSTVHIFGCKHSNVYLTCYKHGTVSLLRSQTDLNTVLIDCIKIGGNWPLMWKEVRQINCMVKREYSLTNKSYGWIYPSWKDNIVHTILIYTVILFILHWSIQEIFIAFNLGFFFFFFCLIT